MTKPMNPTMAAAGIDRRAFLKGAAIMGGATAVAGLAACAPKSEGAPAAEAAAGEGVGVPSFMIAPEQIVEFAATHDHEIVVVGAGVSGVSPPCTGTGVMSGSSPAASEIVSKLSATIHSPSKRTAG